MNQDSLFDVAQVPGRDSDAEDQAVAPVVPTAAVRPPVNAQQDGGSTIGSLAEQLAAVTDPLETARLASQLRDAAERVVASAIRDAEDAGATWRQIGAHLDKPFQTLHRRYGRR